MQVDEGGEGGVDLALGAGPQHRELHPLGTRRCLSVSDCGSGILRTVRVHQQGDHSRLRNQLAKQFEPLGSLDDLIGAGEERLRYR